MPPARLVYSVCLPYPSQNVTNVNYSDPKICEQVCFNNPDCFAYTYVTRPPLVGSCCQKGQSGWGYNPSNDKCTSGVRVPQPSPTSGSSILRLKQGESTVQIQVYIDNTFVEVFWQGGRVATTKTLQGISKDWGFAVSTTGQDPVTIKQAEAFKMEGIWVSNEQVLQRRAELMASAVTSG